MVQPKFASPWCRLRVIPGLRAASIGPATARTQPTPAALVAGSPELSRLDGLRPLAGPGHGQAPGAAHAAGFACWAGVSGTCGTSCGTSCGTTSARSLALGASTPWKRIKCSRGRGTSAASRCMNSSGDITRCVVPSRRAGDVAAQWLQRIAVIGRAAHGCVQTESIDVGAQRLLELRLPGHGALTSDSSQPTARRPSVTGLGKAPCWMCRQMVLRARPVRSWTRAPSLFRVRC